MLIRDSIVACLVVFFLIAGCSIHHVRTHEDMIRYGIELAEKGYWQEAAVQWRMVLNEDPQNVAALNNLGVAAEVNDHPEEAKKLIGTALSYRPEDKHVERNLVSVKDRVKMENTREDEDDVEE